MTTKTCKICKKELPISDFPYHQKTKNTFRPECRDCYNKLRRNKAKNNEKYKRKRQQQNRDSYYKHIDKRKAEVSRYQKDPKNKEKIYEWSQESRKKTRQKFIDFKSKLKCEQCEENHISCLEFHHKDPTKKEGMISKMIFSTNKLKKELKKCIVLCSNCHRKLHYELNNN